MRKFWLPAISLLLASTQITACGDKKDKASSEKKEAEAKEAQAPEPAPAPELKPEKKLDLSGPTAPEVNTTFFSVDGALIPLACFDAKTKKLSGGSACGKQLGEAATVYLQAEKRKDIDQVGASKNALCEVADNPTSFAAAKVDGGATFDFAVSPKSAAGLVQQVPSKTTSDKGKKLSEAETKAVQEAILKIAPKAGKGEFRSQQRVEIDLDGSGTQDLFISARYSDPDDATQNLFSGIFLARGGDLGNLILVDRSKRKDDVITLRGLTDLDGDKKSELWLGLTFDGGSADRVVVFDKADKTRPLAKWSCGA